jgi:hypothetical protein
MRTPGRRKSAGLSSEWVGEELVIYDEATQMVHCLSADAARVFEQCDGERSEAEIALALGIERQTVERALEHLTESGLLDEPAGYSRRDVAKRAAKLSGAAFAAPLIYSVAIPGAAAAISCTPPQTPCGTTCCDPTVGAICCNGVCSTSLFQCGNTCCDHTMGQVCCNGICCASGQQCCNGICCSGNCCGGVCCNRPCCNDTCCTSGFGCDGTPCTNPGECCMGVCTDGVCVGP